MWKEFIDQVGNGELTCNDNELLSQVMDISYQHINRSLFRNYIGADHPDNYFNMANSRYVLIDTEYIDKDTVYGLLLKDKSKAYKAFYFLINNPILFLKKLKDKIFHKSKNKKK